MRLSAFVGWNRRKPYSTMQFIICFCSTFCRSLWWNTLRYSTLQSTLQRPSLLNLMTVMRLLLSFALLCLALSGCSRAIYGVPEEQWQQMSEADRARTIERFNQQEAIYAETRRQAELARESAEKAKQEAYEFERKCKEIEQSGETSAECQKIRRQRVIWPK